MAHHLEGRVDLTAIERSRLLGSLSAGSLGQLGSVTFSAADSSLSQLSASGSDLPRSASPSSLQQYAGRFLPSTGLPPTGTNYAMMASYLASTGHVPDALKHLIPEMQQYWSAAHQDSYARYLLGNMYYPYLPYLPATESLALFAQNSNVAQMEAALQAQAVQHRIYDLQKEALFGQGAYPPSLYPHAHLYSPSGQMEATNLTLPSVSRERQTERQKEVESGRHDIKKEIDRSFEKEKAETEGSRLPGDQSSDKIKQQVDGSERTRGRLMKTEDRDKIKSSAKCTRTQGVESESKKASDSCLPENLSKKKSLEKKPVNSSDVIISDSPKSAVGSELLENGQEQIRLSSNGSINNGHESSKHSPVETKSRSPSRHKRVTSPESCSKSSLSPDRRKRMVSPVGKKKEICIEDQDMPENLCIKDREKSKDGKTDSESELVRTQSIITTSTVNVNSTLDIITTDVGSNGQVKASSLSPSQTSPSLSKQTTVTTYSLPYYHNLYARSQPQDGKRVHATTYVPEIGTVSSPIAGAPSVINVVDTKSKLREKIQSEGNVANLGDTKSSLPVISTKTENSKQRSKDFSQSLYVETNELSRNVTKCDSKSSLDCNNRVCVQSDVKSANGELVSPPGPDFRCSDLDRTIDLSIKKSNSSGTDSHVTKECTKSPVMRKREALHSPKENETDKMIAHDLRKFHDKAHDLRKCHDKTKDIHGETVRKNPAEKRKSCDLNHNSKDQTEMEVSKKLKKSVPSACVNAHENVITLTDTDESSEKSKRLENDSSKTKTDSTMAQTVKENRQSSNVISNKNKNTVRPLTGAKESADTEKKNLKQTQNSTAESPKAKGTTLKQTDGSSQPSGIPVGIAVARQRNIAPKLNTAENDSKKNSEETKKQHPVADVKPIRPLKVIRPSTKGCGQTVSDKRNELPANLIVTGGATPPGVFWPDDPASRQLAAQFLQTGHPLTPTSWYGTGAFPYPQNVTTTSSSTTPGSQMPFTVPAGYKLAQDSVTGQILLFPTGSDVFDSSRLFSGLPVGSQISSGTGFCPPVLPGQSTPATLSATPSLFPGQQADRPSSLDIGLPAYAPVFTGNMLATPDVSIKEDKLLSTTQSNTANVITPSIILTGGHESAPVPVNQDNANEKSKIINLSQTTTVADTTVVPGEPCTYTFSSPAVPIVLNQTLLTTQNVSDQCPEVTQLKQDHTCVQSRGTSPMLPASDSCPEDIEENKSDGEEILEVCDIVENKHDNVKFKDDSVQVFCTERTTESEIKEEKTEVKEVLKMGLCSETKVLDASEQRETDIVVKQNDSKLETVKCEKVSEISENKLDLDLKDHTKSPRASRNIFTDLTEYNPFMDPQVLQAADGLELLSALAEKSAMRINDKSVTKETTETISDSKTRDVDALTKVETDVKAVEKAEKKKPIEDPVKRKQKDLKTEVKQLIAKPRIKCGFAFKPKKEKKKTSVDDSKKMTTFCGISIPEDLDSFLEIDDEVIDSIEMEMKMRLAELQKRYREKQKELAKLTPKKAKEVENKPKDESKQKISTDTSRGPGRPKKKVKDLNVTTDSSSEKTSKSKVTEHGSKTSPTSSSGSSSSGQHGPAKKKKLAEMLVDRVFRKTGSSFKIPLSKKINLIAPARIEFPGGSQATERNEHARHNKAMDFGKLIKRSRLSQINGKETAFVGGLWHRKYGGDRKHSMHKEIKLKKRKKEHAKEYSAKSGLNLLAEYAAKSSTEVQKKKRKLEESNGSVNMSPESPNKKRKPGRPKKCEVVRPGVTETIVAKQSKHMDFFRWQTDETKQERKITLEGKTPLKPLYLDEWNVRRSERIFLSDPSPQTSPNAISPSVKAKQEVTKPEKDKKPKQEKQKKSQSFNMSQKVKKKYSTGFNQNKAREKTTELLKATRDRLTQKRQEKKMMMMKTSASNNDDSDSDDIPLSLFKPKPKINVEPPQCTLTTDELCDGIRILVFMDGLFHEGELKAIRPPDIYGAILDNERKTRPHYYSQEEILKEAIKDTKPLSGDQLKEGTRICAYWSQQFSCLYPGTISRGSPNPVTDRSLYNVEFDDGDTGKIPLDHIRIIPQDFPHVEYDPNPLLLLTARRKTMSTSESVSSEPKKSTSDTTKESKVKRGPGRPPKAERLMSNESIGDEDVFVSETQKDTEKKTKAGHKTSTDEKKTQDQQVTLFRPRGLWEWSGSCTKRPGMKGKAKKEYYKTVTRGRESISVGESAVFLSTGRPNLPYVGRIESFWEGWGGQMVVKVKWFYHPEETKGGKRLQNMKGALFRSDHEDENDVQTISHKCEVISYAEYRRRIDVISHEDTDDVYYLAGSYEPTIGHIKFEPGVV